MGRMTVSPSELNLFFRVQYHTGFDMIDIWDTCNLPRRTVKPITLYIGANERAWAQFSSATQDTLDANSIVHRGHI
jgi:hypothetical protein